MASAEYGKGTNYVKANDPTPSNILDPGTFYGNLHVFYDQVTISAAANLNSKSWLLVGPTLPTGARVVHVALHNYATTQLGTQCNVDVGDEGDQDRYISNIQLSAGPTVFTMDNAAANTGIGYVVTGTTDNVIRISGTADGTRCSTNTIDIAVFYVND